MNKKFPTMEEIEAKKQEALRKEYVKLCDELASGPVDVARIIGCSYPSVWQKQTGKRKVREVDIMALLGAIYTKQRHSLGGLADLLRFWEVKFSEELRESLTNEDYESAEIVKNRLGALRAFLPHLAIASAVQTGQS